MSKNSDFFWWWTYTCFLHTCRISRQNDFSAALYKKDKITALKKYFPNLILVIAFVFFAQSRKNLISSRNFSRMLQTCWCSSPICFRIFFVMNIYMFSICLSNFVTKWFFCCPVQKRQNRKHICQISFWSLHLFFFLHRAEKTLFHHEIFHECYKHVYVHHQFFFKIFKNDLLFFDFFK